MRIRRWLVLPVLVTTSVMSLAHRPAVASDAPDAHPATVSADPASPSSPDGLVRRSFSNADGARDYLLSRPPSDQPVPLIVFLHGCGAAPANYGLHAIAAARGVSVAYPIQSVTANPDGCWNWRSAADQHRGAGEPAIIAGITREIAQRDGIDPTRVFIAGHSAGSGMTAIIAAANPDIYAAAGLLAGCGGLTCADITGLSAYREMGPRARPIPAYIAWGTKDSSILT